MKTILILIISTLFLSIFGQRITIDSVYFKPTNNSTAKWLSSKSLIKNPLDSVIFRNYAASGSTPGKVWYENGLLNVASNYPNVSNQVGTELWLDSCRNNTGSNIVNGRVVRISGNLGNKPTIALASYSTPDSSDAMIGVTTMDIEHNKLGIVTTFGAVRDINTSGFSAGDTLYLSHSGLLTKYKPLTGIAVRIGYCTYSHSQHGIIYVTIERCSDIRTSTRTNITGVLKGANGNVAAATTSDYVVPSTTLTANNVIVGNGGNGVKDNDGGFYTTSTGFGNMVSPTQKLDIDGKSYYHYTYTGIDTRPVSMNLQYVATPTVDPVLYTDYHGLDLRYEASANMNANAHLYPFESTAAYSGNDTINGLYGAYLQTRNYYAGRVNTATNLLITHRNTGTGLVSNNNSITISNPINSGGGTITNNKAINIEAQTTGATNYSIYNAGGLTYLNGNVGIGIFPTTYALDIVGNSRIGDTYALNVYNNSTSNSTSNNAVSLINSTAATVSLTSLYSPGNSYYVNTYNSTTGLSETDIWRLNSSAISHSTGGNSSSMTFNVSKNGGAFSTPLTLNSNGSFVASGVITTPSTFYSSFTQNSYPTTSVLTSQYAIAQAAATAGIPIRYGSYHINTNIYNTTSSASEAHNYRFTVNGVSGTSPISFLELNYWLNTGSISTPFKFYPTGYFNTTGGHNIPTDSLYRIGMAKQNTKHLDTTDARYAIVTVDKMSKKANLSGASFTGNISTTGVIYTQQRIEEKTPNHLVVNYEVTGNDTVGGSSPGNDIVINTRYIWVNCRLSTNTWNDDESDGFTVVNDTFTYTGNSCHMNLLATINFTGGNGIDWEFAFKNVTDNVFIKMPTYRTTTGTTNLQGATIMGYDHNAETNDKYILMVRNLSGNDDLTFFEGQIHISPKHYK